MTNILVNKHLEDYCHKCLSFKHKTSMVADLKNWKMIMPTLSMQLLITYQWGSIYNTMSRESSLTRTYGVQQLELDSNSSN